jgi:succinyl-CoA synthetase beta subunit/citryl-CoA synthetase large subunit
VVSSAAGAAAAAARLGGDVVVKALVPHNRRAKAGLVRFAPDAAAAGAQTAELLGLVLEGSPVGEVLVEERLPLERELFLSFAVDTDRRLPVALASSAGGVDIEETQERDPDAVRVLALDPWGRDLPFRFRELWAGLGLDGATLLRVSTLSERAARAFLALDATILELNPVGLTRDADGAPVATAAGVVLAVDDLALSRQPAAAAVAELRGERALTELERRALDVAAREPYRGTARFMELEGEIGLLVGGGGGSLVFFDAVRRAGGRPACFTEVGGNPSAEKVRGLARVVLSVPGVRGLLVGHNITNNTQVDLVAEGVVAALGDLGLDPREFPVVAREVGTNDERGRELLERAGIEYLGEETTLDAAARRIVERVAAAAQAVAR